MRGETHYYVFAPLDSNVVGYTSQVEHARCNRSEEHTSELQSLTNLVCRLLLEKKKNNNIQLRELYHEKDMRTVTGRKSDPRITLVVDLHKYVKHNFHLRRCD